jgi:hypothetical protein
MESNAVRFGKKERKMPKRECKRYFENAKELLKKSPIEENRYADIKYVQEACGTAYLAVLKALDAYFVKSGVIEKDLPQSVDGYRDMIRKHLSVHNGKLTKDFEAIYRELHISGYYRGNLQHVDVVKAAFKATEAFINKLK